MSSWADCNELTNKKSVKKELKNRTYVRMLFVLAAQHAIYNIES